LKVLFVRRAVLGEAGDNYYLPAIFARLGHSVTVIARAGKHRNSLNDKGVRVIEIGRIVSERLIPLYQEVQEKR